MDQAPQNPEGQWNWKDMGSSPRSATYLLSNRTRFPRPLGACFLFPKMERITPTSQLWGPLWAVWRRPGTERTFQKWQLPEGPCCLDTAAHRGREHPRPLSRASGKLQTARREQKLPAPPSQPALGASLASLKIELKLNSSAIVEDTPWPCRGVVFNIHR